VTSHLEHLEKRRSLAQNVSTLLGMDEFLKTQEEEEHEPLLRKYRPHDVQSMILSESIKNQLLHYKREELPHLFVSGPPGSGKSCAISLLLTRLQIPYVRFSTDSKLGIDMVRKKIKAIASQNTKKVILIEGAHCLTPEAQGALKTTIEQSSSRCIFVFIVAQSSKIIGAIHSRMASIRFTPYTDEQTVQILSLICQEEKRNIEDGLLLELADKTEGNIRQAITFLQQCFLLTPEGQLVEKKMFYSIRGCLSQDDVHELNQLISEQDILCLADSFSDRLINIEDLLKCVQKEALRISSLISREVKTQEGHKKRSIDRETLNILLSKFLIQLSQLDPIFHKSSPKNLYLAILTCYTKVLLAYRLYTL
jgi:DNA polymerase III delta prime subunit